MYQPPVKLATLSISEDAYWLAKVKTFLRGIRSKEIECLDLGIRDWIYSFEKNSIKELEKVQLVIVLLSEAALKDKTFHDRLYWAINKAQLGAMELVPIYISECQEIKKEFPNSKQKTPLNALSDESAEGVLWQILEAIHKYIVEESASLLKPKTISSSPFEEVVYQGEPEPYLLDELTDQSNIKVLFLSAAHQPSNKEHKQVDRAIQASEYRACFTLLKYGAINSKDFRVYLLQKKPQLLHFSGNGQGNHRKPAGILVEDKYGNMKELTAEALEKLLIIFQKTVECVFLNACFSAEVGDLLRKHIPYVIGVLGDVEPTLSIEFAEAFYEALGQGEGVERAFRFAKAGVEMEGLTSDQFILFVKGQRTTS